MLSSELSISGFNANVIGAKYLIRRFAGSPARWYGLENSSIIFEYVPLFGRTKRQHRLRRVTQPDAVVPQVTPRSITTTDSAEDDEDIFSVTMHNKLAESVEEVENEVVGGNTASFKPLVINEDEIEDMGGDSSDVEEHGEG